jgi:hypothetical protein
MRWEKSIRNNKQNSDIDLIIFDYGCVLRSVSIEAIFSGYVAMLEFVSLSAN